MKKGVLLALTLSVVGVCLYFFIAFYGLPWKKASTAKELERYVEEKYAIDVRLKERYYNFKDGSYAAEFTLESDPSISFSAAKYHSGTLSDYYSEAVWVNQVEMDIAPILNRSFPSLSMDSHSVNPVYGMGDELVNGQDIPSYKDVLTGVDVGVHFATAWTEETEELLVKEGFDFIASLQAKGVQNIGVRLYLQDKPLEDDRTQTYAISIEPSDFNQIETIEDLEKHLIIF